MKHIFVYFLMLSIPWSIVYSTEHQKKEIAFLKYLQESSSKGVTKKSPPQSRKVQPYRKTSLDGQSIVESAEDN